MSFDQITFSVQGSAADPYVVTFKNRGGGNISAYCTCPAGTKGVHCKHRLNIINGSSAMIVSGNSADVETIKNWIKGSDLEAAINNLEEKERGLIIAQSEVNKAKKALARAMLE